MQQRPTKVAGSHDQRVVKDPSRYKTVLCNKFEALGKCPYGPRCQFAHGTADLRRRLSQPAIASPHESSVATTTTHHALTPPKPLQPTPSPAPVASQVFSKIQDCEDDDAVELASLCESYDDDPQGLTLHELTGQVLCRRDASYNTLNVRRTISFLFTDDAADYCGSEALESVRNCRQGGSSLFSSNPFGYGMRWPMEAGGVTNSLVGSARGV